MARILLCSCAVRVHDLQVYRKVDVTRECISRIFRNYGFSRVSAAIVCATLENISSLSQTSGLPYLYSLCHTMLSMLRFCRAIKYRGVWHVDVVRSQGAESTSHSVDHVLFLRVNSTRLTNQRRGERGRMSSSFVCFYCAKCDGSEEKQVNLALGT